MSGLDVEIVAALIAAAALAGFIDSIAGGGGLITLPALLLAGLDPLAALATNKLQSSFGSGSATRAFARAGLIEWRKAWPMALMSFLASIAGAFSAKSIPREVLEAVIPLLLIALAVYFSLTRSIGAQDVEARIGARPFIAFFVASIGFYDGLFGPGTGSFFMLGFTTLLGYGIVRATAHTKLLNFASNLGSLAFFAASGAVLWPLGIAMGASAFCGAWIGSHVALRFGARLVRPMLIAICSLMALRLLLDAQNPLRRFFAALF